MTEMDKAKSTDYDNIRVGFTDRQRQVVELKEKGLTHEEIADELDISARTSETHLYKANQLVDDYAEAIEKMLGDIDTLNDDETLKEIQEIVCTLRR